MYTLVLSRLQDPPEERRSTLSRSGILGTWFWSVSTGRFTLEAATTGINALGPTGMMLPLQGLPVQTVVSADPFGASRHVASETCLAEEHEATDPTISFTGDDRSTDRRRRLLQDRRREPIRGSGVVPDAEGPAPDDAALARISAAPREDILDHAIDNAMACRQAVDRLANPELRLLVDMILLSLGQEVARGGGTKRA